MPNLPPLDMRVRVVEVREDKAMLDVIAPDGTVMNPEPMPVEIGGHGLSFSMQLGGSYLPRKHIAIPRLIWLVMCVSPVITMIGGIFIGLFAR